MRLLNHVLLCSALAGSIGFAAPSARAKTVAKPLFTIVYTLHGKKPIAGHLVRWNSRAATIKLANGKLRRVHWSGLTPDSAFTLRARLVNRKSASDWLELGKFGWRMGLKPRARQAFNRAIAMDPAMKARANRIMRRAAAAPAGPVRETAADRAEVRSAIAAAHADEKRFHLHFRQLSTPHFIIFTQWNAREDPLVKLACETAYKRIAKFLGVKKNAHAFVGKFDLYLMNNLPYDETRKLAGKKPLTAGMSLFVRNPGSRSTHALLFRPDQRVVTRDNQEDRLLFAQAVFEAAAFEMCQSYHGWRPLPPWIPVGIGADLDTAPALLRGIMHQGYQVAKQDKRIEGILPGKECLHGGRNYRRTSMLAGSIVATLMSRRRALFVRMINAIRAGATEQQALKKVYKIDNARLQHAWRIFCERWWQLHKNPPG